MNNLISTQTGKRLEEMLNDCSIDAIVAIDAENNIIAWNAIAAKVHGKAKHEVMGKQLFEIIPSIDKDEESLHAIEQARKGLKSFVPASKKYYHRMHAENHFIPLKDETGIKGIMNLVHDVSHRIKAEEQLQYLNEELEKNNKELVKRNEELIALSKVASNDLKEPLRRIYTAVEAIIINDARQLSNNGKAHLRRIQSAAQKMGLITDDLLSFTSITKEKNDTDYSMVDLNNVLNEAKKRMHRFLEDKNAVIEAAEFHAVYGNSNLLIQLFQNILNNAVKFQPKNNQPCIKISSAETGKHIQLSFKDNGIGFKPEQAEAIFNLFTQLNDKGEYSGSGMGLAVCKKIMEQHNGFIKASPLEGAGTEVCCYFPLHAD